MTTDYDDDEIRTFNLPVNGGDTALLVAALAVLVAMHKEEEPEADIVTRAKALIERIAKATARAAVTQTLADAKLPTSLADLPHWEPDNPLP